MKGVEITIVFFQASLKNMRVSGVIRDLHHAGRRAVGHAFKDWGRSEDLHRLIDSADDVNWIICPYCNCASPTGFTICMNCDPETSQVAFVYFDHFTGLHFAPLRGEYDQLNASNESTFRNCNS